MTPRERKDIRWIIGAFVVLLVVACAGIFGGIRGAAEHAGTVTAAIGKR